MRCNGMCARKRREANRSFNPEQPFGMRCIQDDADLAKRRSAIVTALKAIRNVLGTATMIMAGYLLLESLTEARRYIKISLM